jgi:hypothetical protein
LEVRRCGDGHPPVTERERVIRLNGIGGVIFQSPDRSFDPGFLFRRNAKENEFELWDSASIFELDAFPQFW